MKYRPLLVSAIGLALLALDSCERDPAATRRRYPFQLDWPDRRPIGQLLLARCDTRWKGNPRGWFNDKTLDLFGKTGQIDFERRLNQYVEQSIAFLTKLGAQGVIVWDLEGEELPQPSATFAGDPRLLGRLAPEMNAAADNFFKQFTSRGFRAGVCIRPQHIVFDGVRRYHQEEYWLDADSIFRELNEKINYAQRRWGCQLFYIDSNFGPLNLGLYDVSVFRRLQSEHPDSLLIPEFENEAYFSCTAPYYRFNDHERWPGTRMLSSQAVASYPNSFSVINCADADFAGLSSLLLDSVKRGDIFLFRCWWPSPEISGIEAIYQRKSGDGS